MTFAYKSRGTANDNWHPGSIKADSKEDAQEKLDAIFGIKRNKNGKQTNTNMVEVVIEG